MKDKQDFEIIDHPSDIGIKITAKTAKDLFEVAAIGMFSIMTDIKNVEPIKRKLVKIYREPDQKITDMLLIWLEELIYIYEINDMLFSKFEVNKIIAGDYNRDNKISSNGQGNKRSCVIAKIYGEKVNFKNHEIFVSIKAPTYHMLEVNRDKKADLWKAQVIFDV